MHILHLWENQFADDSTLICMTIALKTVCKIVVNTNENAIGDCDVAFTISCCYTYAIRMHIWFNQAKTNWTLTAKLSKPIEQINGISVYALQFIFTHILFFVSLSYSLPLSHIFRLVDTNINNLFAWWFFMNFHNFYDGLCLFDFVVYFICTCNFDDDSFIHLLC